MIKTLSPYSTATTSKTAEIMSRYRPIAPKPELPMSSATTPVGETSCSNSPSSLNSSSSSSMSQKIRQSPYLRNLWPQLQARPTRTRKRGRAAISPPALKRQRTSQQPQPQPQPHSLTQLPSPFSLNNNISLHGFTAHRVGLFPAPAPTPHHQLHFMETQPATATSPRNLVTLPLLPCSASSESVSGSSEGKTVSELNCVSPSREGSIDLNSAGVEIPEEKDLLRQLQGVPVTSVVIAPQPVRPIGSSIRVGCISEDPRPPSTALMQVRKKREEVEHEVEADILPTVISDANNKVRLANSAYKEMVGQPECSWLESMVSSPRGSSRISGEVVLQFCDEEKVVLPVSSSSNGFCCWVRIKWDSSEGKKRSIKAFCNVSKLVCESKDYVFTWRFHTHTGQSCHR